MAEMTAGVEATFHIPVTLDRLPIEYEVAPRQRYDQGSRARFGVRVR